MSQTFDASTEQYLYSRLNYERRPDDARQSWEFKLETIVQLLERRGNPQSRYPIIHVAGTKGKGSVVHMIASILSAAGLRTGIYSSPHLELIRERIIVENEMISAEAFAALIDSFRSDVSFLDRRAEHDKTLHPPTFFEIMTAAAFEYFAQKEVDAAVVEVGLGGRLDSTNVCQPALTVITNIGLDHQRQLGATRRLIAAEKAGIIKPGVPLICGVQAASAAEVIAKVAAERKAPAFWLGRDFRQRILPPKAWDLGSAKFHTWGNVGQPYELRNVSSALIGRHQASNAAIAIAAVQYLAQPQSRIPPESIRSGLRSVQIPGRFQIIAGRPPIVLDIAHNEMSVRAFVRTLLERFGAGSAGRTLLFAASRDKKISQMLKLFLPHFDRVVLTRIQGNPRGCDLTTLARLCDRVAKRQLEMGFSTPSIQQASHPAEAWETARAGSSPNGCIVVAGSAFLVGEMLPVLRQHVRGEASFVEQAQLIH